MGERLIDSLQNCLMLVRVQLTPFMKKYRIKEYIRANGSSFFEIQERILFFWFAIDTWANYFISREEAEKEISRMESDIIVKTKIHE